MNIDIPNFVYCEPWKYLFIITWIVTNRYLVVMHTAIWFDFWQLGEKNSFQSTWNSFRSLVQIVCCKSLCKVHWCLYRERALYIMLTHAVSLAFMHNVLIFSLRMCYDLSLLHSAGRWPFPIMSGYLTEVVNSGALGWHTPTFPGLCSSLF